MRLTGHRLRVRRENMVGHIVRFQCAQNILGPSRLVGSAMSNYQILTRLYGGFVRSCVLFFRTTGPFARSFAGCSTAITISLSQEAPDKFAGKTHDDAARRILLRLSFSAPLDTLVCHVSFFEADGAKSIAPLDAREALIDEVWRGLRKRPRSLVPWMFTIPRVHAFSSAPQTCRNTIQRKRSAPSSGWLCRCSEQLGTASTDGICSQPQRARRTK